MALYLFACGGTGVRVLKALTFLLAAGADINTDTVYPIIIDPHLTNSDSIRTREFINKYNHIKSDFDCDNNSTFFKTDISLMSGQTDYHVNVNHIHDVMTFAQFTGYNPAWQPNVSNFIKLFYSQKDLDTTLSIGFTGCPNIGSVFFNNIEADPVIEAFLGGFNPIDRIFIISSIFGGTGAALFPVLVHKFRNLPPTITNAVLLKESKIGAITMMPYFGVADDPNSRIDMKMFVAKTKAALSYYERSLCRNNQINALYYFGDDMDTSPLVNDQGNNGQKNPAYFAELVAATAIIDFMNIPDSQLNNQITGVITPIYKEFALDERKDNKNNPIQFSPQNPIDLLTNLNTLPENIGIKYHLIRFSYFYLLFKRLLENQFNITQPWKKLLKIEDTDINVNTNPEISALNEFLNAYLIWLEEMKFIDINTKILHGLPFEPFNLEKFDLDQRPNDIINLTKGPIKEEAFSRYKINEFVKFDYIMNKKIGKQYLKQYLLKSNRDNYWKRKELMDLFSYASVSLVSSLFPKK